MIVVHWFKGNQLKVMRDGAFFDITIPKNYE